MRNPLPNLIKRVELRTLVSTYFVMLTRNRDYWTDALATKDDDSHEDLDARVFV